MSSLSFEQTYPVITKFDNIGGLKPQAPVKSAGVVVGRVGDISFDDKSFQALVTLEPGKQLQIPERHLGQDPDLGPAGRAIHRPGSRAATPIIWPPATRIKMTQSAVVLENLISQFLYSKAAEGKERQIMMQFVQCESCVLAAVHSALGGCASISNPTRSFRTLQSRHVQLQRRGRSVRLETGRRGL